ncbi:MAG: hypothetical protein PHO10_00925 [Gemmiger sp.]|nr:hypothetical protein [Gemmiger sp.]
MKPQKHIGRFLVGVVALALISAIGFGAAWAWNSHQTSQENNLQSRTVKVAIEENFPDTTVTAGATKVKAVTLRNTGTAAAFVRVSYAERWQNATNMVEGPTGVTKNWTTGWQNNWMDGGDGWYYYKKVLPAGATTDILSGVTFPATLPNLQGLEYHLDFMVETVQVSDQNEVNADATATLFGKTGAVTSPTIADGAVIAGDVSWS